jgi:hypothetical protein
LTIDLAETARRLAAFESGWEAAVREEAAWLGSSGARAVLADIPALPFEAAHRAGVPAIGLANFSWDWIYRHGARSEPRLRESAERCAAAYAKAELLLRLPFAGDLRAFPRIEDVPLVVRQPRVPRAESRKRLELDPRPAVLLSFGGIGLPGFRPETLSDAVGYQFLLTEGEGTWPAHVRRLDEAGWARLGLGYPDLVGAADVVVTKPGYGIVTDAIGAGTRLVYTDRGDFPEYPILVLGMKAFLPVSYVSNEDVREGRLEAPLRDVLGQPWPAPPARDGAERAAERILARLG